MRKYILYFLFIFLILYCSEYLHASEDMKGMLIYGKNFSFLVSEPEGWKGYTSDAYRYGLNAYFCIGEYDFDSSPEAMYIRVLSKGDYSVEEHLKIDMNNFKKKKSKVTFEDFKVVNLGYKYASKKYIIDDKTCDYLCYILPDKDSSVYLIFVLTVKKEVCNKYLDSFNELLKSFTWIGQDVKVQNKTN